MKPERSAQRRSPLHQVDDILALNARILKMNEQLLAAILKHNNVNVVEMAPINIDELLRNKP